MGAQRFNLYQHSYLGYGLMEARKKVKGHVLQLVLERLQAEPTSAEKSTITIADGIKVIDLEHHQTEILSPEQKTLVDTKQSIVVVHPCLVHGHFETIDLATYDLQKQTIQKKVILRGPLESGGKADQCSSLTSKIFDKSTSCPYEPPHCSFNGVYQPSLTKTFTELQGADVFAFSYFYDRTRAILALENDEGELDKWSVQDFQMLAEAACHLHTETDDHAKVLESIRKISKHLISSAESALDKLKTAVWKSEKKVPELCMDLMYMHHLFTTGYGLKPSQPVNIRKKIQGYETGWCLGAAIEMLSSLPSEKRCSSQ